MSEKYLIYHASHNRWLTDRAEWSGEVAEARRFPTYQAATIVRKVVEQEGTHGDSLAVVRDPSAPRPRSEAGEWLMTFLLVAIAWYQASLTVALMAAAFVLLWKWPSKLAEDPVWDEIVRNWPNPPRRAPPRSRR